MCKYPLITRFWTKDTQSFENLKEIVLAVRQIRGQSKSHGSQRVPIKQCKIFHQDPEYLENTRKLISLVDEEINALGFEYQVITKDLMLLKPFINFKAVGQTFKNDSAKIKKLIENLTQEELSAFQESGSIVVDGKVFTKEIFDVKVSLNIGSDTNLAVYSNKDLILTADLTLDQEVNDTNHCRNLVSAVQQMRKKMGLKPWNKICLEYSGCDTFMTKYKSVFETKLACAIETHDKHNNSKVTENTFVYVYSDLKGVKSDVTLYLFVLE